MFHLTALLLSLPRFAKGMRAAFALALGGFVTSAFIFLSLLVFLTRRQN